MSKFLLGELLCQLKRMEKGSEWGLLMHSNLVYSKQIGRVPILYQNVFLQ